MDVHGSGGLVCGLIADQQYLQPIGQLQAAVEALVPRGLGDVPVDLLDMWRGSSHGSALLDDAAPEAKNTSHTISGYWYRY